MVVIFLRLPRETAVSWHYLPDPAKYISWELIQGPSGQGKTPGSVYAYMEIYVCV